MTSAQTGTGGSQDRGAHWPTTIASLAVGAAFFALWFWLLPSWLGFHGEAAGGARWRWIAALPSVLGFAVAIRCIWDFGRANPVAIAVACAVVLGVALFVLLYEEPTLRKMFGAEYEEYRRNVPRWIPRLRQRCTRKT